MTRTTPHVKRIGHKGADLIEPGNTTASFDAALAAGVDMIEFDVLPVDHRAPETTPLVMAHDYSHDTSHAPTLEEGLDHLAGAEFDGLELDVDLKVPGYERRVVEALRERDLIGRSLISSQFIRSLAEIRRLEPELRVGWSVPRAKRDYTKSLLWLIPAMAVLTVIKRTLPTQATRALGAGRCDALMVHQRLVSPELVRAIDAAGGELYVWTVDDAAAIRRFEAMGVTGIITNDPRLFGARDGTPAPT